MKKDLRLCSWLCDLKLGKAADKNNMIKIPDWIPSRICEDDSSPLPRGRTRPSAEAVLLGAFALRAAGEPPSSSLLRDAAELLAAQAAPF